MRGWVSCAVLVALLGVPAAVSATTFTVNCNAASFSPGTININTGDTIRWVFVSGFSHTVTNGTGGSDPGAGSLFDQTLSSGQSFEFTFTNAGSFDYFCRFHEFAGMKGTVVVASTPVTPATWGKVKNLFR